MLLYALIQDRHEEVDTLLGNHKAQEQLGWTPTTSIKTCLEMVDVIYMMLKKMHFLFPKIFNTAVHLLNFI